MDQIDLKAYAKVNLTLDIVGQRADGYHLLRSIMQSISLADTITLRRQERGITIQSDHPDLPVDGRNICYRAMELFLKSTRTTGGVVITIGKKIPMAAGLGGGSADAAAVLKGANHLFSTNLSLAALQELGVQVGADVPFCLQGGTCLVEGIGEQVTALKPLPDITLVLVKPQASVSTAQVFAKLPLGAHGGQGTTRFLDQIEQGQGIQAVAAVLENSLEQVTKSLVADVGIWKERLLAGGAITALMSGSGPTVFGLFTTETEAQAFRRRWQKQGAIFIAKPMPHGVETNGGDQE